MEFDELVEHLDDLIALARSERFGRFADALCVARARVTGSEALFSRRGPLPSLVPPVHHEPDPYD